MKQNPRQKRRDHAYAEHRSSEPLSVLFSGKHPGRHIMHALPVPEPPGQSGHLQIDVYKRQGINSIPKSCVSLLTVNKKSRIILRSSFSSFDEAIKILNSFINNVAPFYITAFVSLFSQLENFLGRT